MTPKKALINDINPELINAYNQIKENVYDVIEELSMLDNRHETSADCKKYYNYIRLLFNHSLGVKGPCQAARLIYLNKHCFNGLYRVNSKGLFNVPFNNRKKGDSFESENLIAISNYLKEVNISYGDFSNSISNAKKGDFIFFDSPYAPLNPTTFTDYTKEGFKYEDHVRLAEIFKSMSEKDVYCMLTNHNTELISDLYKDYNSKVIQVNRMINSDASNRKGEEIIITNY